MKKFFIEIGISIVMIAIGASLCFFELTGYDHVYHDEMFEQKTVIIDIDKHHPLRLKVDDDLTIQYEYDESMKNQVEIRYDSLLNFKQNDHTIKIKDSSLSFRTWRQYYETFFDGLREHKIVTFNRMYDDDDFEVITITCSKEAKQWIEIRQ